VKTLKNVEVKWDQGRQKTTVDIEVFNSSAEARKFLGEEKALEHLNYAHRLSRMSQAIRDAQQVHKRPTRVQ
jgi:hypothetical protein